MTTILLRRGTDANLPVLQDGEPGWTKDTKTLYIGQDGENVPINIFEEFICPDWFTVNIDPGITDMSSAIAAAIAASYNSTTGKRIPIRFGPRDYKVTSTINGALKNDIALIGSPGQMGAGTRILGYAGAGKPTIDIVGSNAVLIQDIATKNYTSTIGSLMGYDSGSSAGQFHSKLKNVAITYDLVGMTGAQAKAANDNLGTVGIANIGGENVSYDNVKIEAALPIYLSSEADSSWVRGSNASTHTFTSAYATLPPANTWSCGQQVFSGAVVLQAYGLHRPAIAIKNANAINLPAVYTSSVPRNDGNDGTYNVGIQIESGFNNFIHVLSEAQVHAMEIKHSLASRFQIGSKDATASLLPAVSFYGGGSGAGATVYGTDFLVQLTENRYAYGVSTDDAFTGPIKGCNLGSDQQYGAKVVDATIYSLMSYSNYWGAAERRNYDSAVESATASTATATPVTIFAPVASSVYDLTVYIAGSGATFSTSARVVHDGTNIFLLNYTAATYMTITVSGANIQATQTSGGNAAIQYILKRVDNP